jgi:hypothetical protein
MSVSFASPIFFVFCFLIIAVIGGMVAVLLLNRTRR